MSFVKRHPLPLFFVLAYALSWWALPFGVFLPFGPLLASLIVTALVDGRKGLRALGKRLIMWRIGWRWYPIAVGLPLVVIFTAVGLNIAAGAPASAFHKLDAWYILVLLFAIRLINPLDGPGGEELGWRGFALTRLQTSRSPLRATLILGVLVTGWHVPLVFLASEKLAPILLLATFAVTFVYTWIYNRTGGSVLATLIAHAAEGAIRLGALGYIAIDSTRLNALYTAGWCILAVGLVALDRRHWLLRTSHTIRRRSPLTNQASVPTH